MNKKIITLLSVMAVVATLPFLFGWYGGKTDSVPVTVASAARRAIEEKVFASGKVEPESKVKLSSKIAGEIKRLEVKKGDTVNVGDLLVTIDNRDQQAAVVSAEATLKNAKASRKRLGQARRRQAALFDKGMAPAAEMEELDEQIAIAGGNIVQAEAALLQAKDRLQKTMLRAPIAGKVLQIEKKAGELALGAEVMSDVIMVIADMSRIQVVVKVNENGIARVAPGNPVSVKIDALPGRGFSGTVTEIANIAESYNDESYKSVTQFKVTVTLHAAHPHIRPGMSASAEIMTARHENVIAAPIQSVTVRPRSSLPEALAARAPTAAAGGTKEMVEIVFKVKNGRVMATPVKIGLSGEDYFEIISGLSEGDQIVAGDYAAISRTLQHDAEIVITEPTP